MLFSYKNFLLASDKPSARDDQQPIIYIPYDDEYNSWTKLNRRCQRKCRKIVKSQAMFWVNNRLLVWLISSVQSMNQCLSGHHSAGVSEFLRAGHGALQPTRLVEPISRGCQSHFCGPIHCRTFFQSLRPRISRKFRI